MRRHKKKAIKGIKKKLNVKNLKGKYYNIKYNMEGMRRKTTQNQDREDRRKGHYRISNDQIARRKGQDMVMEDI